MTKKERILHAINFEIIDRIPILGGFLVSGKHYQEIAGISEDIFWKNPIKYAIQAYKKLDVDGLIMLDLPPGKEGHDQYRELKKEDFLAPEKKFKTAEDVLAYVESLPDPQQALRNFDIEGWAVKFRKEMDSMQKILGDIVFLPAQWTRCHPSFGIDTNPFGYQTLMEFLGLYPDAAEKFYASETEIKRCISSVIVDVYKEHNIPQLILIGTDTCGANGPVVNPQFLKDRFYPYVNRSIEPLQEAGFKIVWHSDGNIMPVLDDLLEMGIHGFQGFQWEYEIELEEIVKRRTATGEKLIIFAGPSVSSTLPNGSADEVRKEIEYIIDTAKDNCSLFILPPNSILPDVPVNNIVELYKHAVQYSSTSNISYS